MNQTQAEKDEKETGRLEAFSDCIFAFAITLLVLDIKVPRLHELSVSVGLGDALFREWPAYLAYLISFSTILIMWIHHHKLFTLIKRIDGMFLYLNGFLLMFVTLVPFPTALLSEHVEHQYSKLATAIYTGEYVMIAVTYNLLWRYAAHKGRLLDKSADLRLVNLITKKYLLGPAVYSLAFLLSFVNVAASIATCFALTIFFGIMVFDKQRPS